MICTCQSYDTLDELATDNKYVVMLPLIVRKNKKNVKNIMNVKLNIVHILHKTIS